MVGESLAGPAPKVARRLLIASLLAVAVGALVGIATPAGLGWDFANFYDAGGRALHGQVADLYDRFSLVGDRQPQGRMQFWGTPISAFFYAPMALLPPYWASFALKAVDTLAIGFGVLLLFNWMRRKVDNDATEQWTFAAIVAGLALLFQPFWTVYRVGGQTTPIIFLMLVVAFLFYARGEMTIPAVLLVAVCALKPAFVFIPAWLFLVSGRDFAIRLVVVGSAAVGLSVLLLGWAVHVEFLELMTYGLGVGERWRYNSSLYVVPENFRWLPQYDAAAESWEPVLRVVINVLKVAAVATVGSLWWRSRSRSLGPTEQRELNFFLALLLFLLVSGILWEHYLTPVFLLLCHVWATRRRYSRGALVVVAMVSVAALAQNLILIEWIAGRVTMDTPLEAVALGLLKSAPLWLVVIFLWRYGGEFLSSFRGPTEVAA